MDYYIHKKLEMIMNLIFTGALVVMSYYLFFTELRPQFLLITFFGLLVYKLCYGIYVVSKKRSVLRNLYFIVDYLLFPMIILVILVIGKTR